MANCFLYPGQGAQYPGMGRDLWEKSDKVKMLFKTASESTSMDLEKLLFEGSADDLKATDKTQLAITLCKCCISSSFKGKRDCQRCCRRIQSRRGCSFLGCRNYLIRRSLPACKGKGKNNGSSQQVSGYS